MGNRKAGLMGLAAALIVAAPGVSRAQTCGDLNNDGSVNVVDAVILSQCTPGGCSFTGVCGTGDLLDCGDVFGDGIVNTVPALAADLAALVNELAGLDNLFGACRGPGPAISCPGGTVTLPASTITSNQTWPASCLVKLGGTVEVTDTNLDDGIPVVLTIEPGTVIQGVKGTLFPALIFNRGAKIDAQGTPSSPIIMTSDQPPGAREQGDWGGAVFNGRSTVNGPGCEFQGEGIPSPFGGCIQNDSSGRASFVRIQFCGINVTPNNELNCWTMNGIGSQTRFNFIEAGPGNDDCFEWFGGTSNHTNLLGYGCGDDGFDFQLGTTGSLQFGVMFQDGTLTDPGRDSRGIEGDNSEFDNDASPRSNPSFCNLTIIGGENQAGANDGSDAGIMLRRGTHAQVANTIVTDFGDCGVETRDVATSRDACVDANNDHVPESLTGDLIVRSSVFFNNGSGGTEHSKAGGTLVAPCTPAGIDEDPDCNCTTPAWYALLVSGFNVANADGSNATDPGVTTTVPGPDATMNAACTGLGTPYDCCSGSGTGVCTELADVRPSFTGPVPPPADCSAINPVFATTSYLGGVDPTASCTTSGGSAKCGWLEQPWAQFNQN